MPEIIEMDVVSVDEAVNAVHVALEHVYVVPETLRLLTKAILGLEAAGEHEKACAADMTYCQAQEDLLTEQMDHQFEHSGDKEVVCVGQMPIDIDGKLWPWEPPSCCKNAPDHKVDVYFDAGHVNDAGDLGGAVIVVVGCLADELIFGAVNLVDDFDAGRLIPPCEYTGKLLSKALKMIRFAMVPEYCAWRKKVEETKACTSQIS